MLCARTCRPGLLALGAAVFALAVWQANRPVCPACSVQDVWLPSADTTPIRARLYLPSSARTPLPAVIVCHGYLANLAFIEIPWAADLTELGIAALLIDRRGHGWSGGNLWPSPARPDTASLTPEPEIGSAIRYLREHPRIDGTRLAVLGHSDGGTAAVLAGSADWSLQATVALSASVAPWLVVNHVAPRNLLLGYGSADRFVIDDTDRMLIASATRGYLNGPGSYGNPDDGTARRLIEVDGRGHVDLLYSDAARRDTLEWLQSSLRSGRVVTLSPLRLGWVAVGALALLACLAAVPARLGRQRAPRQPLCRAAIARSATVLMLWTLAAAAAPSVATWLAFVPAQEGSVVAAVVVSELVVLIAAGCSLIVLSWWRSRSNGQRRPRRSWANYSGRRDSAQELLLDGLWGAMLGGIATAALFMLLRHLYGVPLTLPRLALFGVFLILALPLFASIEGWLTWISPHGSPLHPATLLLLGVVTAVMGALLFERMAVLPVYLIAATLLAAACHRLADPTTPSVTAAVMASVILARTAAAVAALY